MSEALILPSIATPPTPSALEAFSKDLVLDMLFSVTSYWGHAFGGYLKLPLPLSQAHLRSDSIRKKAAGRLPVRIVLVSSALALTRGPTKVTTNMSEPRLTSLKQRIFFLPSFDPRLEMLRRCSARRSCGPYTSFLRALPPPCEETLVAKQLPT